jgi:hypothetical protein
VSTLLLILLVLLLIGALPAWPYSSGWGYYPSGALGLILLVLLVLFLAGRI